MPNRIIRSDILTSEKVDQLSPAEEVFYRRLLSVVDDYGRFSAKPELLMSACYPLRADVRKCAQLAAWLEASVRAGLVHVYVVDNKAFLEVMRFGQRTRTPSKYPDPPTNGSSPRTIADNCAQMSALFGVGGVVGDGDVCVVCDAPQMAATSPKKEKVKSASRPETKEECVEHCNKNLGLTENDGKALWEHWVGNGFRNDGKAMASWRHVASNWARRRMFFPSLQETKR